MKQVEEIKKAIDSLNNEYNEGCIPYALDVENNGVYFCGKLIYTNGNEITKNKSGDEIHLHSHLKLKSKDIAKEIIENILTIGEIVEHCGEYDLLDEIGEYECISHFDIEQAENMSYSDMIDVLSYADLDNSNIKDLTKILNVNNIIVDNLYDEYRSEALNKLYNNCNLEELEQILKDKNIS
jgi:hypothetical protein